MLLFMHFRILGQSLDEGSLPLMSEEDVIRLLEYVPRFREVEVYIAISVSLVEKHLMKPAMLGPMGHIVATDFCVCDSDNEFSPSWSTKKMLEDRTRSQDEQDVSNDVSFDDIVLMMSLLMMSLLLMSLSMMSNMMLLILMLGWMILILNRSWKSDEDVDQGIDVEWKADPYHNVDELEEPEEIRGVVPSEVVAEEMVTEETVDGNDGDVIPTEVYDAMVSQEQLEDQDGDVIPVKVVAKDKVVEEIVEVVTEVYDAMVAQEMLERAHYSSSIFRHHFYSYDLDKQKLALPSSFEKKLFQASIQKQGKKEGNYTTLMIFDEED
ncbi:hypothetical protein Tco_0472764 [Tanacetum coccineum]